MPSLPPSALAPVLLLLLASPAPAPPAGARPAVARPQAPDTDTTLRLLESLTQRARRSRSGLREEQEHSVRRLLSDLERSRGAAPELDADIDLAILDLAGLRWEMLDEEPNEGDACRRRLARLGRTALERRLRRDPESFAAWLAANVLGEEAEPTPRRLVVSELFRDRFLPGTRRALIRTARTAEYELRESAISALKGWDQGLVHQFFLELPGEDGRGIRHLVEHLEAVEEPLHRRVLQQVGELAARLYASDDWRDAARAGLLAPFLEREERVPLLLDALDDWSARAPEGSGSLRIEWELVSALQRVSGRSWGREPERWHAWWEAVESGRRELPGLTADGRSDVSMPEFFGLRPLSDRVAFVIDRSGSMNEVLGTDGSSRYGEAVRRCEQFLEAAGVGCRFSVTLFADGADGWRNGLEPANGRNVDQAIRWLEKHTPDGKTQLFEGLRTALRLDRRGEVDLERLEADTVIVLCDGRTSEGSDWVASWMRTQNERAQLVFHCVEIGDTGDGTLAELAERSGGQYLRVQP